MNRLDDGVRGGREEPEDPMRSRDRLRLRAAITVEGGPDPRECRKGTIVIKGELDHIFFLRLWVRLRRVLRKTIEGH